jgi:predicted nucleic acid-binding protein
VSGVPEAPEIASAVLGIVTVVDETLYADRLGRAAEVLRLAPASRNGSTNDAHVLALAWNLDADIWSHDRDFAGTGWPSWSSANLRASLAGEPSPAAG